MTTATTTPQTAADLAAALILALQADLHGNSAVAGLLILPMIQRAADLASDIEALNIAMKEDQQ